MSIFPNPNADNRYLVEHINLLRRSFKQLTGRDLVSPALSDRGAAQKIFEAPFAVVSHNASPDPIYTYGNQKVMELFAMTWAEFTSMPSRLSADIPDREERSRLLAEVKRQGFIDHCSGIRIAKTGQRFRIENVLVWNLVDEAGQYWGQGATFDRWVFI